MIDDDVHVFLSFYFLCFSKDKLSLKHVVVASWSLWQGVMGYAVFDRKRMMKELCVTLFPWIVQTANEMKKEDKKHLRVSVCLPACLTVGQSVVLHALYVAVDDDVMNERNKKE